MGGRELWRGCDSRPSANTPSHYFLEAPALLGLPICAFCLVLQWLLAGFDHEAGLRDHLLHECGQEDAHTPAQKAAASVLHFGIPSEPLMEHCLSCW